MDVEDLAGAIYADLLPEYEVRLRAALAERDRDWLVDQLVRLSLPPALRAERDRRRADAATADDRAARLARLRAIDLDEAGIVAFLDAHADLDRDAHVGAGRLRPDAPEPGTALLTVEHRGDDGDALLTTAKDLLYALLFGDVATDTSLPRTRRELLTVTLPAGKAHALGFLQAATRVDAEGTWRDPEQVSHDEAAPNAVLEVEFGETDTEIVSRAVLVALRVVNDLEVNEQVLYARIDDIEASSLDPDLSGA